MSMSTGSLTRRNNVLGFFVPQVVFRRFQLKCRTLCGRRDGSDHDKCNYNQERRARAISRNP
jgi:hypothetical protein